MKTLNQSQINEIIKKHKFWLEGDKENGERANFSNVTLENIDFSGSELMLADFSNSKFSHSNFSYSDFSDSDFRDSYFRDSDFSNSDFGHSDFNCTNFDSSYLYDTNISTAHFCKTIGNGKEIKTIQAEEYWVNIIGQIIQIGCENHSKDDWFEFSDKEILKMDGRKALKFWRKWKPILMELTKPH